MTLHMAVEAHPQYLLVKFTGMAKPKDIEAHYAASIAHCRQRQLNKCLHDVTELQIRLATIDRYTLGRGLQVFGMARIKVAVWILPTMADPGRFTERVAQNAGTQLQAFTELPSALAWLLAADK